MPGLSPGDDPRLRRLPDAVTHLVGEIERRDLTDVVLVGHSWAGFPIAGTTLRLAAPGDELAACVGVSRSSCQAHTKPS